MNNKFKLASASALFLIAANSYADIVHLDDVIINQSLCIGNDCVNGESFGFDTLRLKENNLRIKAQDTSNSASFPTRDWQLTFNDSSNGGANKFSVDDIDAARTPFTIEGGAPSHSLYVDDAGRIGVGTSTPVVQVHVKDGNTPTLRLEQDGSSGFTPQIWDVAGNEANFFIRDASNGSTLPFSIRPGAPSRSIDIQANGDVSIPNLRGGKLSTHTYFGIEPLADFKSPTTHSIIGINTSDASKVTELVFAAADTYKWIQSARNSLSESGATTDRLAYYNASAAEVFTMHQSGNIFLGTGATNNNTNNPLEAANGAFLSPGGTWTNASSRKLKNSIVEITATAAINALKNIKPVTFTYKNQPEEVYAGFIAEDVPELVAMNDRKSLSSMDVTAMLTKVIQEQQLTIEKLNKRMEKLENK